MDGKRPLRPLRLSVRTTAREARLSRPDGARLGAARPGAEPRTHPPSPCRRPGTSGSGSTGSGSGGVCPPGSSCWPGTRIWRSSAPCAAGRDGTGRGDRGVSGGSAGAAIPAPRRRVSPLPFPSPISFPFLSPFFFSFFPIFFFFLLFFFFFPFLFFSLFFSSPVFFLPPSPPLLPFFFPRAFNSRILTALTSELTPQRFICREKGRRRSANTHPWALILFTSLGDLLHSKRSDYSIRTPK